MRVQNFKINAKKIEDNNFNLGLFYFKYLPFLKEELKKHGLEGNNNIISRKQKDHLLQDVINISKKIDLSLISKRVTEIELLGNVNKVILTTQSRFLCGVGYQNRIEWGFSFDWTTGVPYLPGSSFKGALLSYLEFLKDGKQVEDWDENDLGVTLLNDKQIHFTKQEIFEIFGPQGKKKTNAAQGKVIFFDVYPVDFKGLETDVITPHYTEYYVHNKPPADIYNPVPQYFLTVPKDTTFRFMFRTLTGEDNGWVSKITVLIKEAGENYGFGAKTASGYGYFK